LTASPLAVSRFPFGALRYRKDRVVGRRCDKEDIVLRIVSEPVGPKISAAASVQTDCAAIGGKSTGESIFG
jgi:hypothetical protein